MNVAARLSDLSSISSPAPYFVLAALVGLFAAVVWLLVRTGSPHILMSRLWILFQGRQMPAHRRISTFLEHRSALMRFRFMTGVPARTLKVVAALMTWCEKHNEEIGDVALCARRFDLEQCKLKEDNATRNTESGWFGLKLFFLMLLTLTAFTIASVYDQALMVLKESRQYFLLTSDSARIPRSELDHLNSTDCASPELRAAASRATGFKPDDVNILCDLLISPKKDSIRTKAVIQQMVALSFVVLIFAVLALLARREEQSIRTYLAIKGRLSAPPSD